MNSEQEEPFLKLVEVIKVKISDMEEREGVKPTFEDYVNEMIEDGIISMDNLESQMRAHALAWSGAKLGRSDWKKIYNEINNNIEVVDKFTANSKVEVNESKKTRNTALENKLGLVDNFTASLFKRIDNELVRLIKSLGSFSILILLTTFYVTKYLLIEYGSFFTYQDIESEIYTLYVILIIISSLYLFATNDEMKINVLAFIRNFIIPNLMVYLVIVGLIFAVSNLYNWVIEFLN
ncbi:hypothetical protein SY27_12640 [Flavobacterium sp. 316]|uniref:hypothetical protein n=1 Tax=Flavobacterium sp. 316 TaxID=1603293 RepID=UPI0005DC0799|nr:hypothetical protein [Flavobacterium sp. 316]KIX20730.1 hypothetical protein SY27_12640 [Flavobacterium sp. 316]